MNPEASDGGERVPAPRAKISRSRRQRPRSRSTRPLEKLTLLHLAGLLLLATWFFGGGSETAKRWISVWGSLSVGLTLAGFVRQRRNDLRPAVRFGWLWPLLAVNALVLVSCFNPSFSEKVLEGESFLAFTGAVHSSLPSTAHAATSLQHLWLFNALFLSAFNLTLLSRRSEVRAILLLASGNAALLAIFGTVQKLMSDGLFFGAVRSSNTRYFASFVYGNHWAAFAVLSVGVLGGLLFRYFSRRDGSPDAQGRLVFAVMGLLLIAITPAIAGSRAGTLMMLALLLFFSARVLAGVVQERRDRHDSMGLPIAVVALCGLLAIGGSVWLGRAAMEERLRDTQGQRGEMLSGRRDLYRDTWQLVTQQPVFGWGLGTYGKVFLLIRPRPLEPNRQYERSYADAHSDWLQALAEVGVVGTISLGLCALVPLSSLRRIRAKSPLSGYSLLGCGLIVAYALVEFPFGNPAVVITWWTAFFAAVHYARLQEASRAEFTGEASTDR